MDHGKTKRSDPVDALWATQRRSAFFSPMISSKEEQTFIHARGTKRGQCSCIALLRKPACCPRLANASCSMAFRADSYTRTHTHVVRSHAKKSRSYKFGMSAVVYRSKSPSSHPITLLIPRLRMRAMTSCPAHGHSFSAAVAIAART